MTIIYGLVTPTLLPPSILFIIFHFIESIYFENFLSFQLISNNKNDGDWVNKNYDISIINPQICIPCHTHIQKQTSHLRQY